MKRKKTIKASDAYSRVTVIVHIDSGNGLMRSEVNVMADALASKVMVALSDTTHFHTELSKIKVS